MKHAPSLRPLDSVVSAVFGAALIVAAVVLFKDPVARLFMGLVGAWALVEAVTGECGIYSRFKAKSLPELLKKEPLIPLVGIQLILAYSWWTSGWGKLTGMGFLPNFTKTLMKFASENPYPWMKSLLLDVYLPNAPAMASLVILAELFGGAALFIGGALYVWSRAKYIRFTMLMLSSAALTVFLFLNALFYFAAGWTSPSTHGINLVMFGVEAVLLYAYVSSLSENKV